MKNVSIIPEICVDDARGAIAFYKKAFGAEDLGTHTTPDGKRVMHSAQAINGGVVFVCDDFPAHGGGRPRSAKALGGSPVTVHLNCPEVEKAWKKAVKAGAKVLLPLAKQFWGDVYGIFEDPFGQRWSMSGMHEEKADVESTEYKAGAEDMYPTSQPARRGAAKAAPKKKAGKKTPARRK